MDRNTIRRALVGALSLLFFGLWLRSHSSTPARAADESVRLGRQEVSVALDDRRGLAITTVRQGFSNGSWWDEHEGSCELPIPDEAALLKFQVIAPAARADDKPEARGRLEAVGHNLYQMVVNRIPPRGQARCEVVYAQAITRRGRRRMFVYPILAVAPVANDAPIAAGGISVHVRIDAAAVPEAVTCATHPMVLRRPAPHTAVLTYESHRAPDGRDLVVDYELPEGAEDARAHLAVFTPPDSSQDPYFMLTLPPPAALLRGRAALGQPADIVFCMDVSGSTRGRKLNAIQEAVHDGLTDLSPRDRFGVVAFDDDARLFRRSLAPAAPGAVAAAIRFVNRLRTGGGTNPGRALRAALDLLGDHPETQRRAVVIALIIDDDDRADLASVAADLELQRRGIRLAILGALADTRLVTYQPRGRRLRAGPAVAMSRAAVTLGPALAGGSLDMGSLNASYVYPAPWRLPDLPLSTPVMLIGRLNQAPLARGLVELAGKVEGKACSLPIDYTWQPLDPASPVPALWANRRVRRLQQLAARQSGHADELLDALQQVRQEHRLAAIPKP